MKRQEGNTSPGCDIILFVRIMPYSEARHVQKAASRLVKNLRFIGKLSKSHVPEMTCINLYSKRINSDSIFEEWIGV